MEDEEHQGQQATDKLLIVFKRHFLCNAFCSELIQDFMKADWPLVNPLLALEREQDGRCLTKLPVLR